MKTTDLQTLDQANLSAISGGHHCCGHRHGGHRRWYERRAYVMAAQAPTIIIAR